MSSIDDFVSAPAATVPTIPVGAPGKPAALPPLPDLFAQQGKIEAEREQMRGDLEKQREAEQAPLRDSASKASDALSAEIAKPIERVPMPENKAQHVDPKVMSDNATALMALGAFFGLVSRQPFTTSLKNMTAAMEGVQKGDEDQFNRAFDEYKQNTEIALKKNNELMKERKEIIDDKNLDLTSKVQALHLLDIKYDSQLKMQNAPFTQRMKALDGQIRAAQQVEAAHQKTLDQLEIEQRRFEDRKLLKAMTSGGTGVPAGGIPKTTIDYYAAQSLAGDNSWQVGLARGRVGQALIAAVKDRIPQMAAERGMTPQDASTNKAARDATNVALKQRTAALAAVSQFIKQFDSQLSLVDKYLDKGAADGTPIINKWIQAGRKSVVGDPDVSAFDTAIRGAAREHQRIVTGVTSNAQLHVSAQQTADDLLNKDMTADQIKSTMAVMKEEANNAVDAGKSEVEVLKETARAIGTDQAPGKPTPTDKDRDIAKRSPELRAKFKAHFGVDP